MKRNGLTIIELLLAVSLVGLLAGLTLTVFSPLTQVKKARDARRKKDLNRISKLLEDYYNDKGSFPVSLDLGSCEGKLNGISLPCDPLNNSEYHYCYIASNDQQKYKIYAKLEYENDPQLKKTLPNPNYNFGVTSSNALLEENFGSLEDNCSPP